MWYFDRLGCCKCSSAVQPPLTAVAAPHIPCIKALQHHGTAICRESCHAVTQPCHCKPARCRDSCAYAAPQQPHANALVSTQLPCCCHLTCLLSLQHNLVLEPVASALHHSSPSPSSWLPIRCCFYCHPSAKQLAARQIGLKRPLSSRSTAPKSLPEKARPHQPHPSLAPRPHLLLPLGSLGPLLRQSWPQCLTA